MAQHSFRPLIRSSFLLGTPLLLTACAYAGGITPQEAAVKQEVAVNQYMPATRDMRDNIETQELFAQAAFWSHEYDLNPSDLEATLKLAASVRKLGNAGRAVEITQTSRTIHPRDPYLLAEHAAGLIADQRALDAIPVLDQGLRVTQGYGRLWSLKGAALDQMEEYDAARQNYNRALQITPNDPNVLTNLGLSFALSGDLQSAEMWLRRAAGMPGGGSSARENLAMVLQLQGRTDEAERELRLAGMSRGDRRLPSAPVPALSPRGTPAQMSGQTNPAQGYAPQAPRQPTQNYGSQTYKPQGNSQGYSQGSSTSTTSAPWGSTPQGSAPQGYNAQMGGVPATRLTTTGANGQAFTSAGQAARQTAYSSGQYESAQPRSGQMPPQGQAFGSAPINTDQQSVLDSIRQSLQPGAVTPQGQRQGQVQGQQQPYQPQAQAPQPYVVGRGVQNQAPQPQSYAPQGPTGYPQPAYAQPTSPQPSAQTDQRRDPVRRRR